MRIIKRRNVNGLWHEGMQVLADHGVTQSSRAGDVVVLPYPVMSVYNEPQERVLFDANRDANPFFHLMEALWMLAGRDDAGFLNRYVQDFGNRYAETGGVMHGAYGFRWREALGFDQLNVVVEKIRKNPDDRQCVVQMWDATSESSSFGFEDLRGEWKDRPCNTHLYLRVRTQGERLTRDSDGFVEDGLVPDRVLDMTICCRSNDVVWGAYGSNAVHFSVLQEYLAGRIGVDIGVMYQLSNNYHGYVDVLNKLGDPSMFDADDPYDNGVVHCLSMGTEWSKWDDDLAKFMDWHDNDLWSENRSDSRASFTNSWFADVAVPMACANHARVHLKDLYAAIAAARVITASDWRRVCLEWLARRVK